MGYVYRAVGHQLLLIFPGDLAAILPGARPSPVNDCHGLGGRPAFLYVGDLLYPDRKAWRSLDSVRSIPHNRAEASDCFWTHRHRRHADPDHENYRPVIHRTSGADWHVSGNQHLQQLGIFPESCRSSHGRALGRRTELHRKSSWSGRARAHWFHPWPDGFLLLAIFHYRHGRLDWGRGLVFRRWPSRGSRLAEILPNNSVHFYRHGTQRLLA